LAGSAAARLSSGGRESEDEYEREPDRPLVVTALAELGDVTIMLPCAGTEDEQMEFAMTPGGAGEWESALFTILGSPAPPWPAGRTGTRSGMVVYVYGGALQAEEGQSGIPSPLHSHLLAVTRAADGTDAVAAVHRVVLSCPGEYWCHRGGCATSDFPEAATLLAAIAATAETVSVAADIGGPTAGAYQQLYGDKDEYECADTVLAYLMRPLKKAGWGELNQSTWEGGAGMTRDGEHDGAGRLHLPHEDRWPQGSAAVADRAARRGFCGGMDWGLEVLEGPS
jgi:hypothetical protein